jgi:hypothetical protein
MLELPPIPSAQVTRSLSRLRETASHTLLSQEVEKSTPRPRPLIYPPDPAVQILPAAAPVQELRPMQAVVSAQESNPMLMSLGTCGQEAHQVKLTCLALGVLLVDERAVLYPKASAIRRLAISKLEVSMDQRLLHPRPASTLALMARILHSRRLLLDHHPSTSVNKTEDTETIDTAGEEQTKNLDLPGSSIAPRTQRSGIDTKKQ